MGSQILKVSILPGEYWWGGTTMYKKCPIHSGNEYHEDFREKSQNQTSPFFVSSMGRYIWSDEPFKVDVTGGVFTIEDGSPTLTTAGTSLREAYMAAQKAHFPCDQVRLRPEFFRSAQYNTWMEFTYYPTQEGVLRYAKEWLDRGFKPGIFIIDEGWHQHTDYGHWEFDFARFPDPKKMVTELHELGYKVMLWVVPFVSPNGPRFVSSMLPKIGADPETAERLYMRTETGEVALMKWWNGTSAILDMTNPYDVRFLDDQLQHLIRDYGVDGFKFDGGTLGHFCNSSVVNGRYRTEHSPAELNAAWNEFGRRYPFHEYKDTFKGGGKNVIQRLHDRFHTWEGHGIDDILPCAIVNGLIGHPFTCPDMVGGGSWTTRLQPGFKADEELFVRMAQVSALFPMMQFSWAPWEDLSPKNVALCLDAANLHSAMSDEILQLVDEATLSGEPILRCLEYNDPHQGYELIEDEFMLGEDILVAPVVTKGTFRRKVTFPAGQWQDQEGTVYDGHTMQLLNAPLEKLLWFRRVK